MIRREALLRAAPDEHGAELEMARAERDGLMARGPDESVLRRAWRRLASGVGLDPMARFDAEVTTRVVDLQAEWVAEESAAKVEEREAQLQAATEGYAAARGEFESVGQEMLERRLEVLHSAGAADIEAYEAGLADRAALAAAAGKREAAAAAAW